MPTIHVECRVSSIHFWQAACAAMVIATSATLSWGEDAQPLHQRIDALLEAGLAAPPVPSAQESTLVRRLYLDLAGTIPSREETKLFLDDQSPDKWERLVDSLLADPRFVDHMVDHWDVAIMERRADKHVKTPEWRAFLEQAVRENRPFHQLASEILSADGSDPKQRGPARFYLDREVEPNLLTRDIGRVFFGVDLQCAQCHDHPLIDDYYQADYYGLYAFVSRLSLFADKKKKISYLSEKADGEVKFTSVFTSEAGKSNPRLPFGVEVASDPVFAPGDEYKVKPSKDAAGVPKHSRRVQLAAAIERGENPAFRRNIANRLWAIMMGRGLVHPVDLHHSDNPPSHPELLRMLSDEIADMNFDVRAFLKQIALTDAYRRDYQLPREWTSIVASLNDREATWQQRVAESQVVLAKADKAFEAAEESLREARVKQYTVEEQLAKLRADELAKKTALDKASTPLVKIQQQVTAGSSAVKLLDEALAAVNKSGAAATEPVAGVVQVLKAKHKAASDNLAASQAEEAKLLGVIAAPKSAWEKAVAATKPVQAQVDTLNAARIAAEANFRKADIAAQRQRQVCYQWQAKLDEKSLLATAANQMLEAQKTAADLAAAESKLAPIAKQRDPILASHELASNESTRVAAELAAIEKAHATGQSRLATLNQAIKLLSDVKMALAQQALANEPQAVAVLKVTTDRSEKLAKEKKARTTETDAAAKQMAALVEESEKARLRLAELDAQLAKVDAQWKPLQDAFQAAQQSHAKASAPLDESVELLRAEWARRFAMTDLKGLTSEQLCWSILEATGQVRIQKTAALAALNKKSPLSAEDQKNPSKVAARDAEAHQVARTKLQGNVATFVKLFAAAPGQPQGEFFATADQALFFRNGSQIRGWVGAGGDSLYGRLSKLTDPAELANDLYMTVLSRNPNEIERQDVIDYLAVDAANRGAAIQDMIWALITSIEFRFRH